MKPFRRIAAMALAAVLLMQSGVPGYALETESEETIETVFDQEETTLSPEEEPMEEEPTEEETEPEETEESILPDALPGMPQGFALTEAQLREKWELAEHQVSAMLETMTEGADYEAGVVMCSAESEAYAQLVADAYDADLLSWEDGLAILGLRSLTVMEAIRLAEDPDVPLPAVDVNAIVSVEPVASLPQSGAQTMTLVPEALDWSVWIHELMDHPDEFLSDPADSMYQWHHDVIDTYSAWGVTMGDPGIRVAVIDTGADMANRDLQNVEAIDIGMGEEDVYGHGTHVTGIIGATADNTWYGAGIAPNVTIYSIRASGSGGSFTYAEIVKALRKAIELDVHLVNMSLGGAVYSSLLENVVREAWSKGITIIAAAGNEGSNLLNYPAAFDTVISVGATDMQGTRAYFSNYGSRVDVFAPGYQIPSTYLYGSAAKLNGTSMACPVVTGAAALYMSKQYQVSGRVPEPETVRAALRNAASDGVLNAGKLFSGVRTAPVITVLTEEGFPVSGSTRSVTVDGTLAITQEDSNNAVILYTLDGKTPAVKDGEIVNGQVYSGSIALDTLEPGSYPVRAASLNDYGVLSRVAKITMRVLPGQHPQSITVTAPERLIAGKSVTLTARVCPESASQSVSWELVSGESGASITKAGRLTAKAGFEGEVKIQAVSAEDKTVASEEVTIQVEKGDPISSVVLEAKSAVLRVYHSDAQTFRIHPTALDSKKQALDPQTIAFSFSSSNPKVAAVSAEGLVTARTPGTASITVKALDGSNKSAVCKITVKAGLESAELSGQLGIAPGSSGSYRLTTVPKTVSGASVTWSLVGAPEGVTVSAKGVVKVSKAVQTGQYFGVRAVVTDGVETLEKTVWVQTAPKASAVHIFQGGRFVPQSAVLNKSGFLTSAKIYSTDVLETVEADISGTSYVYRSNRLQLEAETVNSWIPPMWSSSNPSVATVDGDGLVIGYRAGTAKITCKAQDGSGKSASVTIKVLNPVSSLYVDSPAARVNKVDTRFLGYGKSVTNIPVLGTTYGTPSDKSVEWSVTARMENFYGASEDVTQLLMEKKMLSISKSGKLTIKAGAENLVGGNQLYLKVHARTMDGTDLEDTLEYAVARMATQAYSVYGIRSVEMFSGNKQEHEIYMDCAYQLFTVKSSKPEVAGASIKQDSFGKSYVEIIAGQKSGTAKITVRTADGSNRTFSISVQVG